VISWRGAECIILGCTEITLLVGQADTTVPVFDTTAIHAIAALEAALLPELKEEQVQNEQLGQ
jgi:aspartate racemase